MTLRVSRTKRAVIVTVPMQCDLATVDSFLNRHIDWVRDRLGTLPLPVSFADGVVLPVRGHFHRVVFTGDATRTPLVQIMAHALGAPGTLAVTPGLAATSTALAQPTVDACSPEHQVEIEVHGRVDHAPRHLRAWLFEQARCDLDERVAFHAKRLGVRPKRIAIRDQTSRWGSCSTTGVLSFSWRLILAPSHVLDYVAAHEVAHFAEMNHGPRFWKLVRQTMPAMDTAKSWLSTRGIDLHRYGAV